MGGIHGLRNDRTLVQWIVKKKLAHIRERYQDNGKKSYVPIMFVCLVGWFLNFFVNY